MGFVPTGGLRYIKDICTALQLYTVHCLNKIKHYWNDTVATGAVCHQVNMGKGWGQTPNLNLIFSVYMINPLALEMDI
jgi:hypothetical protein